MLFHLILGPELARWRLARRRPVLWWRDDDARAPTEPLIRLLHLSHRYERPLTLAAVPDGDIAGLAVLSQALGGVSLAIHGFRHENRAPAGQPSGEVTDADSVEHVAMEIAEATRRFRQAGVTPRLFVPPWNNVHPTLLRALQRSEVPGLSGFDGPRHAVGGVRRLDTHLDLMRWKGGARFRGQTRFLRRMRRLLAERRRDGRWDEPLGLLTHHLDHDEAAWRFLDQFLASQAFTWRSSAEVAA